jgi:hypothetical protein
MEVDMELKLLGVKVEGQPDPEHSPRSRAQARRRTHWMIKLGPYEAHIIEWNFGPGIYDSPPYKDYSYQLKIGSEYVLNNQPSVMTSEEAISIIDGALLKYLTDKRNVENLVLGD